MLGIGNSWWSFAGLMFDATGFAMLAWDLLPEYKLNRFAQNISRSREAIETLSQPRFDEPEPAGQEAKELWKLRRRFASLTRTLARSDLYLLGEDGRRVFSGEVGDWADALLDHDSSLDKKMSALEAAEIRLQTAHRKAGGRKRPPIRLAISLIIIGFLMQAWGAIPV